MRRTLCAAGLAALSLMWAVSAFAGGSTLPGTNSVFVSASGLSLPSGGGTATLLTGKINKGKKKTVRAIEAMLTNIGQSPAR